MNSQAIRRHIRWPLLAAAFVATVAANPQCAQVDDRITAPDGSVTEAGSGSRGSSVAECVRACNEIAKTARERETRLHLDNIAACRGSSACKRDEAARHAAAMQEIAADERDCKAPCHEQGGGSGGQ